MRILTALLMSIFASVALAESSKEFGDYTVHYSVFNSTFITPEIAKSYGLRRGTDQGIVNIAVLKKEGTSQVARKATIKGKSSNLIQQQQWLTFIPVIEGDAVYYLANFRFDDQEVLHFDFDVSPSDSQQSLKIKFTNKLHRE